MNILVNEGNRRLRNHSPHLTWDEKKNDVTTLMIQMEECGHKENFCAVVAVRIVLRYLNSLQKHRQGEKRMYRSEREQQAEVAAAGGRASKSNWFKKGGATQLASHTNFLGSLVEESSVPGWSGGKTVRRGAMWKV